MPVLGKCPKCNNQRDVILLGGFCHAHFSVANSLNEPELQKVADRVKKPIKKVSAKRKAQDREYAKLKKQFMVVHPTCEAQLAQCTKVATDIHHKAGRGVNMLNTDTWLSVCRNCHTYIETHPSEAKEKGLSISRLKKGV